MSQSISVPVFDPYLNATVFLTWCRYEKQEHCSKQPHESFAANCYCQEEKEDVKWRLHLSVTESQYFQLFDPK